MSAIVYTPMTTIRLYGALRQFGREFRLSVNSTGEAIKALCVQVPGLEKFLADAHMRGMEFAVFRGKTNIGENELGMNGKGDIRIAPVIRGSKRAGALQTVLGVVLIVVGAMTSWAGGTNLMMLGASLVAGGVIQMMSPQASGLRQSAAPENQPSYAFGSARNTTASGNPVAFCVGYRRWGGAIISAGIYAEDQA